MGISCCAMLILCLSNIGELQLFSSLLTIVLFHFFFYVFVTQVLFLFLGASIVLVNNLKRTSDYSLVIP